MAQARERLLLAEYIKAFYPNHRVKLGCPLGPVAESLIFEYGAAKAYKVARPMRPEVDALIWDDKRLILVEAKILRWVDGLSKLPLYSSMVPQTPELQEYISWPRVVRLVIPFVQENMAAVASSWGIEVVQFSIPEIDKYLTEELPYYQTAEYRQKRVELLAARKNLGLE